MTDTYKLLVWIAGMENWAAYMAFDKDEVENDVALAARCAAAAFIVKGGDVTHVGLLPDHYTEADAHRIVDGTLRAADIQIVLDAKKDFEGWSLMAGEDPGAQTIH